MHLIGVASQLGNGKDKLCDHLVKVLNDKLPSNPQYIEAKDAYSYPVYWQRSAFANAVKDVFETSFGVDRDFTEKWKRIEDAPPGMLQNVRKSLQFIGDGFREIRDEIWIEIALRNESKKLIISDSRYINEAKAIKAKGGITVVLYRPGHLNDDPNPSESQIRPVVEWCAKNLVEGPIHAAADDPDYFVDAPNYPDFLQYYDYFMVNDGTLEDLYDKVERYLVPFIERKYSQ